MNRVLLLAMALILSSCGLFEKTVTKRQLDSSVSATVEVARKTSVASNVSSTSIDERAKVTAVPGRTGTATAPVRNGVGIITDSAGLLLVALIDSLSGNLTVAYSVPGGYSADYWRGVSGSSVSISVESEVDSSGTVQQQVSASAVDKERKPSSVGTSIMWIGVSLLAIAVIWAVAKFVLKR